MLIVVLGVWELNDADLPGALQAAFTAPIGINEMVLAGWLIFRGFAGATAARHPVR